jgi:peptidoglycan/xylan/chitin deacetylase (PgdA/CDA1 family)
MTAQARAPERFDYAAIVDRPRLVWPGGARVALWVAPNVEHYEYLPAVASVRDPWPRTPHPDVLNYGIRDYGNRVGFWRLLEVLDRHRIRCTVSLNYAVLEMYPEIHAAMQVRQWEYMSHGLFNTRYHWNLSADEERAEIAQCVALHERFTGRGLAGWFSPAASFTLNTPDLVAEAGIKYYCDFYHDDQPTPLKVRAGKLISIPYTMEINDSIAWRRPDEGEDFARAIRDEFDTLWHEGEMQGRVMCIALHPFITGQPHRIAHLDAALRYVLSHDGVWCATGEEIADWYLAQQPAIAP